MIPELEDFEKRGYFKKAEIKQMVKKRLQFEYLLKRKKPLKADFLRSDCRCQERLSNGMSSKA